MKCIKEINYQLKNGGHRSFQGILALKREIQVNKYTTDTGNPSYTFVCLF